MDAQSPYTIEERSPFVLFGELLSYTFSIRRKNMADFSPAKPPVPPLASTLPDDIAYLAATHSFGSFHKVYRAHYRNRVRAMLIGCPLLILGPVVLCVGVIALFSFSYVISDALGLQGNRNVPQYIAYGTFLVVIGILARVAIPAAWRLNASGT